MNQRELFYRHVAQTSAEPIGLEIVSAEGVHLYDANGKSYLDLIGGISVCNTGHRHPKIVEAIKQQADRYLHLLVYGELIQSPQVRYAEALASTLPPSLNSIYFTNSGAEATEGAMKLAKRATGRTEIVAFNQSYHGSTQGALSIIGDEYWRNAFRPLLPGINHVEYNNDAALDQITNDTACVIMETVQAESGIIKPRLEWIKAVEAKCKQVGALLVLDEIQSGFGRTGKQWGFENFGVIPDIVLAGKALGGGMPLGAFMADKKLMNCLIDLPVLGHITTFGGHPVSCAAGLASLKLLLTESWINDVKSKESLLHAQLNHSAMNVKRSAGLWMAVEFADFAMNKRVISHCLKNGLLTDWFLFAPNCLRIAPPLVISEKDIRIAAEIIIEAVEAVM